MKNVFGKVTKFSIVVDSSWYEILRGISIKGIIFMGFELG